MRKLLLGFTIAVLATPLLTGCSKNDGRDVEQQSPDETARKETVSSRQYCFRNEYPIDDTRDIEELIVLVDGNHATGEYNWIPAYKDKRSGRFSGSLQDNAISASYEFVQEGRSATTTISISLEEEQAIVKGGPPELGLNLVLARVDC